MADETSLVSPQSRRKFLKSGLAAGGALSVREGALAFCDLCCCHIPGF